MKAILAAIGWSVLSIICWVSLAALIASLISACAAQPRGFDWAIQGKYSQLDCAGQPGARPYYVNVNQQPFFMGCR